MSFEVVQPNTAGSSSLTPTSARLRRDGLLVVRREALDKVNIQDHFVLLVDKATRRLAVRRVHRDDAPNIRLKVRTDKPAKARGCAILRVAAAFKAAGWPMGKACKLHGVKDLVKRDDGLLIVLLEKPSGE